MQYGDELVLLAELDRDDAVRLERRVVVGETRLLDNAVLRREHEVLGFAEVPSGDEGAHAFALRQRKQIDECPAFRLPAAQWQLVYLEPVDLPDRGEEEQVVVRRGDDEVLDVVLVLE